MLSSDPGKELSKADLFKSYVRKSGTSIEDEFRALIRRKEDRDQLVRRRPPS